MSDCMSEEELRVSACLLPGWCILEVMGHRKIVGYVTEVELAGAKMLRVDAPRSMGGRATQLYPPSSVYCLTPCSREAVEKYVAGDWDWDQDRHLRALPPPAGEDFDFEVEDEDPDPDYDPDYDGEGPA